MSKYFRENRNVHEISENVKNSKDQQNYLPFSVHMHKKTLNKRTTNS